jgi:hypothetical protein
MNPTAPAPSPGPAPTEAEIRAYAHQLYIQSGGLPGRDLENWLEAEAYLTALARRAAVEATPVSPPPHSRPHRAARPPRAKRSS